MKHLKEIYSPGKHKLVQSVRHTLGVSGRYGGQDTSQDFEDEANRQGYRPKILGSGVMGSVIDRDSEHPAKKNQVYKIFKDPAYHSFAKMAYEKSSENPHYPKIHALGKLKGTSVGVARLEKLKELHDVHPMRDVLGGFTNPFRNVNGASVSMRLEHHPIGQELKQRYPEFHKALSEIAEKHPNHRFDLHMGNIMQRGEGPHATPVITDPIIKQDENNDFVASDEKEKEQTHTKTFASNIPKVKKFEFGDHLSSIPQVTFKQKTDGHWALTRKKDSAGLKPKSPNSSELTHPPTLREDGGAPTAAPTNNAGSGAIAGLDNNPPVRKKQPILRRKSPVEIAEAEFLPHIKKNSKLGLTDVGNTKSPKYLSGEAGEYDQKPKKLSTIKGLDVYRRSEKLYNNNARHHYTLHDPKTNKVHMQLTGYVYPKAQGVLHVENLASSGKSPVKAQDFYHHLLKNHVKALVGTSHSEGGQKVWNRLAAKRNVSVHGWNIRKKQPVNIDATNPDETHNNPSYFQRLYDDENESMGNDKRSIKFRQDIHKELKDEDAKEGMPLVASYRPPKK